jgi:transcriptional regulator with XRE-family HTH domain
VENDRQSAAAREERPDPEVQAGRALRRLRTARGWSQEEVGRRMKAYGYDFHQTMIAKIEAAQRPLRVRELADFAALYGMEVHELIYPPAGSLKEVSREIDTLTDQLQAADKDVRNRRQALDKARAAAAAAEEDFRKHEGEAAMLRGRLTYLEAQREKLAEWEPGE